MLFITVSAPFLFDFIQLYNPRKTDVFRVVLKSACLSVCLPIFVQNTSVCQSAGRGINPFPNKPWFLSVCSTSLLKTMWEKKKLLVTNNFSFSHSVFYPFGELSAISIKFKIVVCKLFQFGRV